MATKLWGGLGMLPARRWGRHRQNYGGADSFSAFQACTWCHRHLRALPPTLPRRPNRV